MSDLNLSRYLPIERKVSLFEICLAVLSFFAGLFFFSGGIYGLYQVLSDPSSTGEGSTAWEIVGTLFMALIGACSISASFKIYHGRSRIFPPWFIYTFCILFLSGMIFFGLVHWLPGILLPLVYCYRHRFKSR